MTCPPTVVSILLEDSKTLRMPELLIMSANTIASKGICADSLDIKAESNRRFGLPRKRTVSYLDSAQLSLPLSSWGL